MSSESIPPAAPAAPSPSPTNYVTDATTRLGNDYLSIVSNGVASGSKVNLSDGSALGIVQRVEWSLDVGGVAKAVVTTFASPGDLRALVSDTTLLVRPAPGYHPLRYLWDWYAAKLAPLFGSAPSVL
jgi:hypothetical protein